VNVIAVAFSTIWNILYAVSKTGKYRISL